MDETTIKDIQTRTQRWEKGMGCGKDSERTWIFAVNIDDVNLLLSEITRLTQENTDLRLQLFQARESLDEDHHPDGKEKWWFTPALGPHKARDTQTEREFSHGPFDCRETADIQWKLFLKERPSHDPV